MRSLLNPANLLSLVRLAAVPWLIALILDHRCELALYMTLFTGLTDFADGYVARRFGLETQLGAYLDPIADKGMLVSLYVCFGAANLVPQWLMWLVVGRDVLILVLAAAGMLWTQRREYPPTFWGKLSTVIQIGSCLVFLSICAYPNAMPASAPAVTYAVVAVAAAISGIHYLIRAFSWARETPAQGA